MTPSTFLEEQALAALWYTTLVPIFQQLVHKGYVARQQHRSWHGFTPRLSARVCGQQQVAYVTTYFQGSYSACLAHCVQQRQAPLATIQGLLLATPPSTLG